MHYWHGTHDFGLKDLSKFYPRLGHKDLVIFVPFF
jgi:hypothetical protein